MPLQLICGRAHSGKSTYLLDIIKRFTDAGKKIILVVPEQFAHIAEMRLLRRVGRILDDYIEITSFNRLAMRTMDMTDGSDSSVISSTGKSLVMSRLLADTELEYYSNISNEPGFVDVCLGSISEFKKYNVSYEQLEEASEGCNNQLLAMKLRDLNKLYHGYEQAMEKQFIDSDDLLNILYNTLKSHSLYSDCVFLFDEFSTFIPQEERIISELIKQSQYVYMTLCMDRNLTDSLFLPSVTTYNKMVDICRENHYRLDDTVWLNNTYYANSAISFAEGNMFSYPTGRYEGDVSDIQLVKAKNPYSEVDNAARHIISLVRDRKLRYRDVCIICSDTAAYNHIFYNVFTKYGIPFFLDEKTKVLQHHIVLFVLNVLDVYLNNYSYESIFNFIKSGFMDIEAEQISMLENFILKTNVSKNTWLDDERWNTIIGNYAPEDSYEAAVINRIRDTYILPLSMLHDAIKGKNSAAQSVELLYEYLCSIRLPEVIKAYVMRFEKANDTVRKKEYESVWNVIVRVFDEVHSVIGQQKVNVEQLRRYLYIAFAHQSIGVIPTSVDQVIIGDIARTRTDKVKAVVIIGANEGLFPVPAKNNSVISDKEKNLLAAKGVQLSTTADIQSFYNQFLIYKVITMPDSMLYVSYSTADSSYNTLAPSFAVERIKKMFGNITVDDTFEDTASSDSISGGATTFENLVSVIKSTMSGERCIDQWHSVYRYYSENEPGMLDVAMSYFKYTNPIRPVSADNVRQHIGQDMHTTVSRLQKYASCRYSYFLSYMLYLKEKPTPTLQSVDIGSIAHDIIEKICIGMEPDGVTFETADKAYFERRIDEMLDMYIAQLGREYARLSKRQLYSVRRLKNVILLCFDTIKKQITESKFVPLGYEIVFDDDNIGCIEIQLEGGKTLKLTGKIDRADVYRGENKNYLRVIDYKTGSKTFNLTDVVSGLDIQLLVYLNALVESDSSNGYGGAFFFPLSDVIISSGHNLTDKQLADKLDNATKMKGIIVEDTEVLAAFDKATTNRVTHKTGYDQFAALSRYLKRMIAGLWSEIMSGNIDANPYRKSSYTPCTYCPYSSVCRIASSNSSCSYNDITTLKDSEAWSLIEGGEDNVD